MSRNQVSSIAFGQVNSAVRTLPGASVYVEDASGGLAILYASESGSETIDNPMRADDSGKYVFFVSSAEESYTITVTLGPVSYSWEYYPPDNIAAAGLIYEETWVDLIGRTANLDGAAAEVVDDAGTHNDATDTGYDGGEVANQGRYRWNEAWGRWERLPDLSPALYGQPYESEEAFEAASVPGTISAVRVINDGTVYTYIRSDSPADLQSADGQWWLRAQVGASAYETWISEGNVGDEAAFLASLQGDEGPEGPAGPTGPQGPLFFAYSRAEVGTLAASADDGTIIWLGTLAFEVQDGATVISDIANVIPAGDVTPNHFAENTTPGTTDMAPATQSAADYAATFSEGTFIGTGSKSVYFVDQEYYLGSKITLLDGYDRIHFRSTNNSLLTCANEGPAFQISADEMFDGGDTSVITLTCWAVEFHSLRFQAADPASTQAIAIRSGRSSDLKIIGCDFNNFYIAIDWHRQNTAELTGCRFMTTNRTSAAPARAHLRCQGVYDSTNSHTPGGGNHIGSNEWYGNSGDYEALTSCIEVNCVDGLYFEGANHFNFYAENGLLIAPDASAQNNKITDIENRGTFYFDGECNPGSRHINITGSVASGGYCQRINLAHVFCRGGNGGEYGVVVSVTDAGGWVADRGGVTGLSITNGKFYQQYITSIRFNGPNEGRAPVVCPIIHSNHFKDGNNGGAATTSYIGGSANGFSIVGNVFEAEANPTARAVSLDTTDFTAPNITFANNDLSKVDFTTEPYRILRNSDALWNIGPNLIPSGKVDENLRETTVEIDDDNVAAVDLPFGRYAAIAFVQCQAYALGVQNAQTGVVRLDAGDTPAVSVMENGSSFAATTGTLTGTTGTDGFTTVSPDSQQLQIENRSGFTRSYTVTFL